jgi:hypothetical protein
MTTTKEGTHTAADSQLGHDKVKGVEAKETEARVVENEREDKDNKQRGDEGSQRKSHGSHGNHEV